jgi:hypothetical protein
MATILSLSIKSEPDLEFLQSRHVREIKAELPCGNRSAEAEHFFDEDKAECGHYIQTLFNLEMNQLANQVLPIRQNL